MFVAFACCTLTTKRPINNFATKCSFWTNRFVNVPPTFSLIPNIYQSVRPFYLLNRTIINENGTLHQRPALQVPLKGQLFPGPVRTRKTPIPANLIAKCVSWILWNYFKFSFFFFKERKVAPKCVTWILWNYSNFFFFFFFLKERKVAPCGRHWRYPDAYLPCPEAPWVHASPWSHPPGAMATSGYTPDGRPHDYID